MRHCEKQMFNYCHNNTPCRQAVLFHDFSMYVDLGTKCNCCDICCSSCNCIECCDLLKYLRVTQSIIIN